ncbi:hypothetical protein BST61_g2993 [Cercospora zeina]
MSSAAPIPGHTAIFARTSLECTKVSERFQAGHEGMWRHGLPAAWPRTTHHSPHPIRYAEELKAGWNGLTGIAPVSRVEIFKYDVPTWRNAWDFSMCRLTKKTKLDDLWATWTEKNGWLGVARQPDNTPRG